MGKKEQQETRAGARTLGTSSTQEKQKAFSGGGAFGDVGLTGDRAAAQTARQNTLGDVKDFTNIAKGYATSGGFDTPQLGKLRSGYEGFATTGGFTPEQEAAFRRNATSVVPATYDVLKQEAQRKRAITGGLGAGGELAQMARQQSEVGARANTAAEVELANQERAGKLSGLAGLGGVEGQLAANRIGATQGGGALSQGLYNAQTGEISDMGRQILEMMGIDSKNQAESLNVLQSLANTPGIFDNIMRVGGLAANVLGGMGGAGLLGGLTKLGSRVPGMVSQPGDMAAMVQQGFAS